MVSHRSGSFLQHSQVSVSRIIFNLFLSQSLTRAEALIRSTEKTSLSSATQRAELLEVSLRLLISRMTCPLSNWGQDRYPRCACEIPAFHFCRAFTSPSFKQSLEVVICESSKKGRPFPTTQPWRRLQTSAEHQVCTWPCGKHCMDASECQPLQSALHLQTSN